MIGYLKGNITWEDENQVIVEVNGVGYLVEVVDSIGFYQLGDEIELYIYTYVREDALKLYGFKDIEERKLFVLLLSVSGIGPKASLNILSSLSYNRFINAILTENVPVLKEVSGIGPKTAQRLILELKNKIDDLAVKMNISNLSVPDEELYDALNNLGYSNKEIERAVNSIDFDTDVKLEEKIKEVLSFLGKESF